MTNIYPRELTKEIDNKIRENSARRSYLIIIQYEDGRIDCIGMFPRMQKMFMWLSHRIFIIGVLLNYFAYRLFKG